MKTIVNLTFSLMALWLVASSCLVSAQPAPLISEQTQQQDIQKFLTDVRDPKAIELPQRLRSLLGELPENKRLVLLVALLHTPAGSDPINFEAYVISEIGALGPKSMAAVPELTAVLTGSQYSPWLRQAAIVALGQIGPMAVASVPALLSSLNNALSPASRDTSMDRYLAISETLEALGELGPAARSAVPTLTRILQMPHDDLGIGDADTQRKYDAYRALGSITGSSVNTSVAENIQTLERRDQEPPEKAAAAFLALQASGRKAVSAVPILVTILRNSSEDYIKASAIQTLKEIGPGASAEATQALIDVYKAANDSSLLDHLALEALGNMGSDDTQAVKPLLLALVSHPTSEARSMPWFRELNLPGLALDALTKIGPGARAAVPVLVQQLAKTAPPSANNQTSTLNRTRVLVALAKIGMPGDPEMKREVLQAIREDLTVPDRVAFANTVYAAGALGADAKSLVPLLLRGFQPDMEVGMLTGASGKVYYGYTSTTSVKLETIRALGRIGPAAAAAIPALEAVAAGPEDIRQRPRYWPLLHENQAARSALRLIQGK